MKMAPSPDDLPIGLDKRIKLLVSKDPIVERQVNEMAPSSLRFSFLKQCRYGNIDKCTEIWRNLDENDRQDFTRAFSISPKSKSHDLFFLNMLEPDACTQAPDSSDCTSSSLSDLEFRS